MADYDLGTARGRVEIDSSGAVAGLGATGAAADGLDTKTRSASRGTAILGGALIGIGAIAVTGFALAVNAAADFEKQMSGIQAVSGATAEQMQLISDKALQLGADTKFSAGEAALAMEELVKAGLSVDEVLNGAADATVFLAAAGEIALPEAATIASNAMNQFKLSAEELPKIADLLAGAANASATGVSELGLALSYVGPVANTVGLSIEDTAGALAVLANNGIDANKSGTALRAILVALQPQSDKAKDAMKELGLFTEETGSAFFDAEGKIKPMNEIIGILNESFGSLTAEQRLQKAETIFGREALAGLSAMAATTKGEYEGLAGVIGDTSAQEVAETRMDNLAGSIEEFKGSIETFMIKAGKPFLEGIRTIVDHLTTFVNWLGELSPETQKWIGWVVVGVGILAGLAGVLVLVVAGAGALAGAIAAIGGAALIGTILLVVAAVVAIGVALVLAYQRVQWFRDAVNATWEFIRDAAVVAWNFIKDEIIPVVQAIADVIVNVLGVAIGWLVNTAFPWLIQKFQEISGWINDHVMPVVKELASLWFASMQRMISIFMVFWNFFFPIWEKVVAAIKFGIGIIVGLIQTFGPPILTVWNAVWHAFQTVFMFVWNSLKNIVETILGIIAGIIHTVTALIQGDWGEVWNGIKMIFEAIWNGIQAFVENILTTIKNLFFDALEFIKSWWDLAWAFVENIIFTVLNTIWGFIQGIFGGILDTIGNALGNIKSIWSAAWNFVSDFVSNIWNNIRNGIQAGVDTVVGAVTGLRDRIFEFFGGAINWLYDKGREIIQGLIDGVKSMLGPVGDAIGFVTDKIGGFLPGSPVKEGALAHPQPDVRGAEIMRLLAKGIEEEAARLKPVMNTALTLVPAVGGVVGFGNRGGGDVIINIHFGDVPLSDREALRQTMNDPETLRQITQAARAGAGQQ